MFGFFLFQDTLRAELGKEGCANTGFEPACIFNNLFHFICVAEKIVLLEILFIFYLEERNIDKINIYKT
jgi:hypothetical protein